jgi:hypothetical protein
MGKRYLLRVTGPGRTAIIETGEFRIFFDFLRYFPGKFLKGDSLFFPIKNRRIIWEKFGYSHEISPRISAHLDLSDSGQFQKEYLHGEREAERVSDNS